LQSCSRSSLRRPSRTSRRSTSKKASSECSYLLRIGFQPSLAEPLVVCFVVAQMGARQVLQQQDRVRPDREEADRSACLRVGCVLGELNCCYCLQVSWLSWTRRFALPQIVSLTSHHSSCRSACCSACWARARTSPSLRRSRRTLLSTSTSSGCVPACVWMLPSVLFLLSSVMLSPQLLF
jgi:hypothetical protein